MIKSKKAHLIAVFLIIVLGFVVYANSLDNGFVYDDDLVVKDRPFLTSPGNLRYFFSPLYFVGSGEHTYRPVLTLTYLLDYHFWKFNPFGYHLTNVIIHILNGILLYFLFLRLVPSLGEKLPPRPLAFLAGIFFVLHPVQTEVVNGIAFRDDALLCVFFFASLIFYLKAKSVLSGKSTFFYVLSLLCYFLALLTKEMALLAFFIILPLIDICAGLKAGQGPPGDDSYSLAKRLSYYAGYIAVSALYLYITFFGIVNPVPASKFVFPELLTGVLTSSRILITYLRLLVFPLNLSVEYVVSVFRSAANPEVLFSLLALAAIACLVLGSFRRRRLITFSGLWTFAPLAVITVLSITPGTHLFMAERFLYLPCAGFCLFLAAVLAKVFHSGPRHAKQAAILLVILILSFYSLRTAARNRVWKNELVFWSEEVRHPPTTVRAYSHLGFAYFEMKMYDNAIEEYKKALDITPDYKDVYNNLGRAYFEKKMYDEARENFQLALKLDPDHVDALNNLGRVYLRKQEYPKAEEEFKKAIKLDPFHFQAHNNLGLVYFLQGHYDEAAGEYKTALRLKPDAADVYTNLGIVYFKEGFYDKAKKEWEEALEIDPDNPQARRNLEVLKKRHDKL